MGPKGWSFRLHNAAVTALAVAACAGPLFAGDVAIAAAVDKSVLKVGDSLTLTVTLSGDLSQVAEAPRIELPDGFRALAKRQASTVSVSGGTAQRAMSFEYLLQPLKPGVFRLGPFTVDQRGGPIRSEPINVTVKKPVLPPSVKPQPRLTT